MDTVIRFYDPKKENGELSNYYGSKITIDGIEYATSEHYYQANKFTGNMNDKRSLEYVELIRSQNTPNKAKILASQKIQGGYQWKLELNEIIKQYPDVSLRKDWEYIKVNVMQVAVMNKFLQNPTLKDKLLSTGNAYLVEHTSRDSY